MIKASHAALLAAPLLLACAREPRPAEAGAAAVAAAPHLELDAAEPVFAADGLVVERQRWRLRDGAPDAEGVAWRARVPLSGKVQVVPSAEVVGFDALLPGDEGPWAAINGGFYESGPMGLVVTGGEERHPLSPRGGSGVLAFGPEGARVLHRDAWTPGATEALQSIDRLIDQGESVVTRLDGPRAARSAFVQGEDALWLVALAGAESVNVDPQGVVQLDDTVGEGLSMGQFAEYLRLSTRPVAALNLDGAVSTQFAARFWERRLQVRGERGTINAVVLRP